MSSLQLPYEGDQSIWKQFIRLIELVNFAFQERVKTFDIFQTLFKTCFKLLKSTFIALCSSIVSLSYFQQAKWLRRFDPLIIIDVGNSLKISEQNLLKFLLFFSEPSAFLISLHSVLYLGLELVFKLNLFGIGPIRIAPNGPRFFLF